MKRAHHRRATFVTISLAAGDDRTRVSIDDGDATAA